MSAINRRQCLTFLAANAAALLWPAAAAQSIEVIELRHRPADELLPLLQPFIEPGGTLTGQGYQLFIRSSTGNRRQIEAMIARLDRAARSLLISVRQGASEHSSHQQRDAQGRLILDSRGLSGQGTVYLNDTHRTHSGGLEQRIQVLEGGQASLSLATAVPFTFHHWLPRPGGAWIQSEHTVYYEAVSGFSVRPTLAGELVTLEIAPQSHSGSPINGTTLRLATQVQGRLGQWIALGEVNTQATEGQRDVLSRQATEQNSQRSVWVKVELLSP